MKTPLCFQITEFDCGTTSALNAIKYLFHREEIPAALLQGIYAYTLTHTYNSLGQMQPLVNSLNESLTILSSKE